MKRHLVLLLWLFEITFVALAQELTQEPEQQTADATFSQPGPWKRVHLSWKASRTPGVRYRIYRAWAPLRQYVLIGQTHATTFIDWPWPGQYLYRVTAVNAHGESSPTAEISVVAPQAFSH